MDPLTHFLTGACLGRAGLNRKTAYATLVATLAAEAPDIDVLASFGGPVAGFTHHRGITHTLVGAPFMALAVTLIVYAVDRAYVAGRRRHKPLPIPVDWLWVWLVALVADFSHLLLDYTNNYGLRPFYPFNPRWYSADLVFIIEPLFLLLLGGALILPSIFALVDREMTKKRPLFRGRGLALAALVCMVLVWALRNAEHAHALSLARAATLDAGPLTGEPLLRIAAEPYPLDPFHWHILAETKYRYESADIHTLTDTVEQDTEPIDKPPVTPAVSAAKQSHLGRVFLDWSSWPLTVDLGSLPIPHISDVDQAAPPGSHTVRFTDMRFAYARLGLGSDDSPPLAGWVSVSPSGGIETEAMNGRVQH